MTGGGRIKRIKDLIADKDFCLTYGDGLSDVNINDLIDFHKKSGKEAILMLYIQKWKVWCITYK